jgi:dihydropteroate synthase
LTGPAAGTGGAAQPAGSRRGGFRVMGVLNVTPDSFSDGGLFARAPAAIEHARKLVAEGADIIDVGGESTRPGAEPVSAEEELARVGPVLERLDPAAIGAQISIDTRKAPVARAALAAGASFINDVSALRADPQMAGLVADSGVECCLMHMRGEPHTMQRDPRYTDVVDEVKAFLHERLQFALHEGVAEEQVLLDPGIGFGKTAAHNLELLRRLDELLALGRPLLIGTSRKSFIARTLEVSTTPERPPGAPELLAGTVATNVLALARGASVFRVHEVAPVRAALAVAAATLRQPWTQRTAPTKTARS